MIEMVDQSAVKVRNGVQKKCKKMRKQIEKRNI